MTVVPAAVLPRALRAVAGLTVVSGALQMVRPDWVLGELSPKPTPLDEHLFGTIGMFMVVSGGTLDRCLAVPSPDRGLLVWAALQKLGASAAVGIEVPPPAVLAAGAPHRRVRPGFRPGLPRLRLAAPPRRGVTAVTSALFAPPDSARPAEARRSLVLAGGGMRVAYQAGVLAALEQAGLRFHHVDGASGGTMNLSMLLGGQDSAEIGQRWRTLRQRDFSTLLPWRDYARSLRWPALGGARGLREKVFPHLGIDPDVIRRATGVIGTYNVCNFAAKTAEVVEHPDIDMDLLVAAVSLPVLMPAVVRGGTPYTDAVLDPGQQRPRGGSPGERRDLAGVVHRQHSRLPQWAVPAVRPHDRDGGQRLAAARPGICRGPLAAAAGAAARHQT